MATVIGLILSWLRASALHEHNLSSTYLAWLIASEPGSSKGKTLKPLLEFQQRCLATSYLTILDRLLRLPSAARRREEEEHDKQMEQDLLERLRLPQQGEETPEAPWERRPSPLQPEQWRRRAGIFRGEAPDEHLEGDSAPPEQQELLEPRLTKKEVRRLQRDHERVRIALEQFARMVSDYESDEAFHGTPEPRRRQPSQRQLRQAREALTRFAQQFEQDLLSSNGGDQAINPLGYEDPAAQPGTPIAGAAPAPGVIPAAEQDPQGAAGADQGAAAAAPAPFGPAGAPAPGPAGGHPLKRLLGWLITRL